MPTALARPVLKGVSWLTRGHPPGSADALCLLDGWRALVWHLSQRQAPLAFMPSRLGLQQQCLKHALARVRLWWPVGSSGAVGGARRVRFSSLRRPPRLARRLLWRLPSGLASAHVLQDGRCALQQCPFSTVVASAALLHLLSSRRSRLHAWSVRLAAAMLRARARTHPRPRVPNRLAVALARSWPSHFVAPCRDELRRAFYRGLQRLGLGSCGCSSRANGFYAGGFFDGDRFGIHGQQRSPGFLHPIGCIGVSKAFKPVEESMYVAQN
jgi:hypothetical protein